MVRRLAAVLCLTVLCLQAAPAAAATTSASVFGDPYRGSVSDLCDVYDPAGARPTAYADDTVILSIFHAGGEYNFYCEAGGQIDGGTLYAADLTGDGYDYESIGVLLDETIDVRSSGDVIIVLAGVTRSRYPDPYSYTGEPESFLGISMDIRAAGDIIFFGDGLEERDLRFTATDAGVTGDRFLGLENVEIVQAQSVRFYGGGGDDRFDGSAMTVDVSGGGGEAGISGGAGRDLLVGGVGRDVIEGGADADLMSGNAGDDDLATGSGNDVVHGGAGDDTIDCDGGGDREQCAGDAGDDEVRISANGAPDTTVRVLPGDGADHLEFANGGHGVTLDYGDVSEGVSLSLEWTSGGGDRCQDSDFGEDTASGDCDAIEAIVGSSRADAVDASGVDADGFAIAGGAGDDRLAIGDGEDVVVEGGAGDDRISNGDGDGATLEGGAGSDRLVSGSGDGHLEGGPGADRAFAGEGDDTILAGRGADLAYGEAGDDSITGGRNADRLSGGSGIDTLDGSSGDDQLHGDAGDDVLDGQGGFDRAWGDADTLADGGPGDSCAAEVAVGCEWVRTDGPDGPYWLRIG